MGVLSWKSVSFSTTRNFSREVLVLEKDTKQLPFGYRQFQRSTPRFDTLTMKSLSETIPALFL
jgi:hypothetical protein